MFQKLNTFKGQIQQNPLLLLVKGPKAISDPKSFVNELLDPQEVVDLKKIIVDEVGDVKDLDVNSLDEEKVLTLVGKISTLTGMLKSDEEGDNESSN